jgi:hypothetical protein
MIGVLTGGHIQIVTGLANGQICVLYSPNTSINGAKLLLNKGPPRKATIEDMSDALAAPAIITPHALPMFRDGDIARGTKRKREKDRMDPRKSKRPELPVTGPGKGGRVGASATQHVVQNLVRDTTRDEDVRILLFVAALIQLWVLVRWGVRCRRWFISVGITWPSMTARAERWTLPARRRVGWLDADNGTTHWL